MLISRPLILGIPKCSSGKGHKVMDSIMSVLRQFITADQYCNFTGDGVYEHTCVGEHLSKQKINWLIQWFIFKLENHYDSNLMH